MGVAVYGDLTAERRDNWRLPAATGCWPSPFAPPGTQQFEQLRRQHRMASLPPLPRSTRSSMRSESISPILSATTPDAQPGAVGGGECRLVLRRRCRAQQKGHFLDAEHWVSAADTARRRAGRQIRPVERHCKKEAQGRDRAVDVRRLQADLRLVQLEKTQVFRCRRIRRPADKGREGSDRRT